MTNRPDYPKLVAQAESAVAAVKDPELKRAAFEKVMDDLLAAAQTETPAGKPRRSKSTPVASERKAAKAGGPQAYVEELVTEGFFKKPKTLALVKAELENRGHHIPFTSLSGPLQKLCQRKMLRRQRAAGKGNKQTFSYSEW